MPAARRNVGQRERRVGRLDAIVSQGSSKTKVGSRMGIGGQDRLGWGMVG